MVRQSQLLIAEVLLLFMTFGCSFERWSTGEPSGERRKHVLDGDQLGQDEENVGEWDGSFDLTDSDFDLTIEGKGYFQLVSLNAPDEVIALTRCGHFARDEDGFLFLLRCPDLYLYPLLRIPSGGDVAFACAGHVRVRSHKDEAFVEVGRIELADFGEERKTERRGSCSLCWEAKRMQLDRGMPRECGFGEIVGGMLDLRSCELGDFEVRR